MRRIPVDRTIGGAYRFLFHNGSVIAGTVWLPLLLLAVVIGGVGWLVFEQLQPGEAEPAYSAARFAQTMAVLLPLIFFGVCLVSSMVLARLTRHAVGKRTAPTWAYASLGRDVWRILPSFFLFDVVLTLAAFEADELLGTALMHRVPPVPTLIGAALCLVAIYMALRTLFFVPAVVAVEHRLGVGRSWSLTRRSFARLGLIAIAIGVPTALLAKGASLLVTFVSNAVPDGAGEVVMSFHHLAPLIAIVLIGVVQRVLNLALIAGASASAYRALVPER